MEVVMLNFCFWYTDAQLCRVVLPYLGGIMFQDPQWMPNAVDSMGP